MKFEETGIAGVVLVQPERLEDDRGYFARTFCEREFQERGLRTQYAQSSTSFNRHRGTLRGLHFQAAPHEEVKLVRCTRGAVHDVVVDLRPGSPTFRGWIAAELTEENGAALYIPAGCAHGFLTLRDASEVLYQIDVPYHPPAARGVRWDDPAFGVRWPAAVEVISDRDRAYPDFVA